MEYSRGRIASSLRYFAHTVEIMEKKINKKKKKRNTRISRFQFPSGIRYRLSKICAQEKFSLSFFVFYFSLSVEMEKKKGLTREFVKRNASYLSLPPSLPPPPPPWRKDRFLEGEEEFDEEAEEFMQDPMTELKQGVSPLPNWLDSKSPPPTAAAASDDCREGEPRDCGDCCFWCCHWCCCGNCRCAKEFLLSQIELLSSLLS